MQSQSMKKSPSMKKLPSSEKSPSRKKLPSSEKSPSMKKLPSRKKSSSREKKSKMQISREETRAESLNNQYKELYAQYISEGKPHITAQKKARQEIESRQRMMEMADEIDAKQKEIRDRETSSEREHRNQKEHAGMLRTMESLNRRILANATIALNKLHLK